MAKGYWVANCDIFDLESFKLYRAANQAVLKRHGAKILAAGGRQSVVEGESSSRQTIFEFSSYDAAVLAYEDPEYQQAATLRKAASTGDFVIVEGFEPS